MKYQRNRKGLPGRDIPQDKFNLLVTIICGHEPDESSCSLHASEDVYYFPRNRVLRVFYDIGDAHPMHAEIEYKKPVILRDILQVASYNKYIR